MVETFEQPKAPRPTINFRMNEEDWLLIAVLQEETKLNMSDLFRQGLRCIAKQRGIVAWSRPSGS